MILTRAFQFISRFFADENLTKKAYLNFINNGLTYIVKLVVQFIITPLMVAGLGTFVYGLWQVINRTIGYISPASGRPTEALQWVIARDQSSKDLEYKRQYLASALIVWAIFLPLMVVCGSVIAWFIPAWFDVPLEYISMVRITALILIAGMVMQVISELPQSILRGENLGYKRMGLTIFLTLIGGLGTWAALALNTGLIGIAAMSVFTTVLNACLYLILARKYIPWFGVSRPPRSQVKEFLGLSGWFMAWNLVWTSMFATDVVLLGLFTSVELVTVYTLTKYVPEILINITQFLVAGVGPGLGGIIGRGEMKRAADLRGEMLAISWLVGTAVGVTVVIWNNAFLNLWVGADKFAGSLASLLIVVAVFQFIMIQNDAGVIDVTLRMSKKVILGIISIFITIASAILFIKILHLDIIGITLALILGRLILSIGYPMIVGNALQISFKSQLRSAFRPFVITALMLVLGYQIAILIPGGIFTGFGGWVSFFMIAAVTFLLAIFFAFFFGLTSGQRSSMLQRVKIVLRPR